MDKTNKILLFNLYDFYGYIISGVLFFSWFISFW